MTSGGALAAGPWPTTFLRPGETAILAQRFPQYELDLSIQAAQFIIRPRGRSDIDDAFVIGVGLGFSQ